MKFTVFYSVLLLFLCSCSSSNEDHYEIKASCIDGVKNGTETGVDCGGDCEPCATCDDGIMNGDETGIDCGGNCDACIPQLNIPKIGYDAPKNYSGYSLKWNDEFESNDLDTNKWGFHLGNGCPSLCYWGNSELQYFTNRKDNVYFDAGNLIIEAKNENIEGHKYTSSRIHTDDLYEFQYGRVDIRAAMPNPVGTWTALFMMNKNYDIQNPGAYWPSGGEIDIMEYLGEDHNDIMGTGHYGTDFPDNHRYNSKHYKSQNGEPFNEAYYVYSIVWEEDKITWLVNDVPYHTLTPSITEANGQPYPFNDKFYFVLALSVGGNLPTVNPIPEEFPAFLIVDYIRVYQKE
ncbi:family 16 glycosylhydrolase [Tamlana sp. I1]|uniref:glycoside hydrolase family 16 protein n=1 Tax=Tamlana sp. I1 TaxID=2762061 RepID=UPI00189099C2|nr:glycoside hydrolase family 16 protein [Tamlana sp. I1]